ncbi:MAG: glycosyltransferase [Endomicrobia bacterium]|nr:glycosyltransferase [Endomicrobiia bacterium]
MKKVDLHIHSKYSEHPSEWFLQRLGAAESYTEPEFIFKTAKERGMDFVTITDHNRIEGVMLLKEKYPDEVVVGMEATAYFPEDGCKIHILLFGIDEKKYQEVQKVRNDIYEMRDWIKTNKIAYSVAHPTYSVNEKLKLEHLEKLILLFDVFEGRNGGRDVLHNDVWVDVLKNLSSLHIEQLYNKYKIEPFSDNAWIKGFTGGSDDHAGIFIGKTYTIVDAQNIDDLLYKIRNKETSFEGRHNDFKSLAFTVYKVAYDFSKEKSKDMSNPLMASIIENLFNKKSFSFFDKIQLNISIIKRKRKNNISNLIMRLAENLKKNSKKDIDEKLEIFYSDISNISDEFIKVIFESFEKDIKTLDLANFLKNMSYFLSGVFLSVPFFSAFKHLNQDRELLNNFIAKFQDISLKEKNILWFTDTINDLNGVSVTLKKIASKAYEMGKNLRIVSSFDETKDQNLPSNVINLPSIYQFRLPYYEQYILRIPSVLKSLKELQRYNPDEIYISTPGPLGLVGLLMSKVFCVKSVGVFHTDFTEQAKKIVDDESLVNLVDAYVKWFYSCVDRVEVPSVEYMRILEERGYDKNKLKIFKRGIDLNLFYPRLDEAKNLIRRIFNLNGNTILLYVGRISKDKNLDFLIQVYKEIIMKRNHLNLLIVGDGPYKDELKAKIKNIDSIIFIGKIEQNFLPYIYSGSDLFVFPSITDTFGMVVLEAQACGLPAVVSDKGGSKNIILDGKTGFVAKADDLNDWIEKIKILLDNHSLYLKFKEEARKNIEKNYSLNTLLKEMFKY